MTDYGLPYIDDKKMFAAVLQARRSIVEQQELPSTAIMQAASRYDVNEADVGYYATIAVAWSMAVRTLRREERAAAEKPSSVSQGGGIDHESMINLGG